MLASMVQKNVKKSKLKEMLTKLHRHKYLSFVLESQRYGVDMCKDRLILRQLRIESLNSIFYKLCEQQFNDKHSLNKKVKLNQDIADL